MSEQDAELFVSLFIEILQFSFRAEALKQYGMNPGVREIEDVSLQLFALTEIVEAPEALVALKNFLNLPL